MHNESFFIQAFIYLVAAILAVPLAKRLGLGSVLGYLLAGVIIGPYVLGLVGDDGGALMRFSEFGVVMMLFLVGLELKPALLWQMRTPILGLGGLQVLFTTVLLAGSAMAFGLSWKMSLAVGMILSLSSTAIVLQSLTEKGLMKTESGHQAFSVLLFQDIAVIPMLALMPLLETKGSEAAESEIDGHGHTVTSWVEGLPTWGGMLGVLAAVALVVLFGRFLVEPVLRAIARTRLREMFTAAALVLVIGIALLMVKVGLSPALGTFLAGVVLAGSEYRHELEGDIEPFKGLLLGLFFISVGATLDFSLVGGSWPIIFGLVALLIGIKLLVLWVLGILFRMGCDQRTLFAFALAQAGEFAFVLFAFAGSHAVLPPEIVRLLTAVVVLTMALTPLMILFAVKVLLPRTGTRELPEPPADDVEADGEVIIAGFGRFGHIIGRLLGTNGFECTVLDHDSDQVEFLRRLGLKVFYGDAARVELLQAAGAAQAKLLVLAIDDPDKALEIVHKVRKHFPQLEILARANGRADAYELLDAGVDRVFRETLDSSLNLGVEVLKRLGMPAFQATRAAKHFRRIDEESVRDLAEHRHDQKAYISRARERIRLLDEQMKREADREVRPDTAWDTTSLRG